MIEYTQGLHVRKNNPGICVRFPIWLLLGFLPETDLQTIFIPRTEIGKSKKKLRYKKGRKIILTLKIDRKMSKGSRKKIKVLFLVARPLRPNDPPPPRAQWPHFWGGIFFRVLKKVFFITSLSGRIAEKTKFFLFSSSICLCM